jgi:hypothetical protein
MGMCRRPGGQNPLMNVWLFCIVSFYHGVLHLKDG